MNAKTEQITEKVSIEVILIACCKSDFYFTKICVASVRYWYPSIKIQLIKDLSRGNFDTTEMEQTWDVSLFQTKFKHVGFGLGKLIPLFEGNHERTLVLDSDIIFIGDVLSSLVEEDNTIIVHAGKTNHIETNNLYFDTSKLLKMNPVFRVPDYLFNTGHFVINQAMFQKTQLSDYFDFSNNKITSRCDDTFKLGDQGFLNYFFFSRNQDSNQIIVNKPFTLWSEWQNMKEKKMLEKIKFRIGEPYLIHYAGQRKGLVNSLSYPSLLLFYEEYYYFNTYGNWNKMFFERFKRSIVFPIQYKFKFVKKIVRIFLVKTGVLKK